MRIRRVDPTRSLFEENAYTKGINLFLNAKEIEEKKEKLISVLIVGCGKYGSAMVRVLIWLCQMEGYRLEINVIDSSDSVQKHFESNCPDILSPERNGCNEKGETRYTIRFHNEIEVDSPQYSETVKKLTDTTYAFVALGSDEMNIHNAIRLRVMFERMRIKPPEIQTIVYDADVSNALREAHNSRGQFYNIDFIGDIESCYSEKVICDSRLEHEALLLHKNGKYHPSEDEFYYDEYNYLMSKASAIFRKSRDRLNIPGVNVPPKKRTQEQIEMLKCMEHGHWNAYMRMEGYIYADEPQRDDLKKTHPNLVNWYMLDEETKQKDIID